MIGQDPMGRFVEPDLIAASNQTQDLRNGPRELSLPYLASRRLPRPGPIDGTAQAGDADRACTLPFLGVLLHFEQVVGKGVPPVIDVYLNLPPARPVDASHHAGILALYGLQASSTPATDHAGTGLRVALEVTDLFNRLRARPGWDPMQLRVRLEPREALAPDAQLTIGRVSLLRQR